MVVVEGGNVLHHVKREGELSAWGKCSGGICPRGEMPYTSTDARKRDGAVRCCSVEWRCSMSSVGVLCAMSRRPVNQLYSDGTLLSDVRVSVVSSIKTKPSRLVRCFVNTQHTLMYRIQIEQFGTRTLLMHPA